MRRVIDDTMYEEVANDLENTFSCRLRAPSVSEYSWGTYRASVRKVKDALLYLCDSEIKFGSVTHAHGIGNNNAIEIIYIGNPKEEQICGLVHLIDDMFGGVIFYVTDIDGKRKTGSWIIRGVSEKDPYAAKCNCLFAMPYSGK